MSLKYEPWVQVVLGWFVLETQAGSAAFVTAGAGVQVSSNP